MNIKLLWSDVAQKVKFERKSIVVFVDVLRACSTFTHALNAGAASVYVTKDINNALTLKEKDPKGTIIAGERGGIQLDGFDMGNSPIMISKVIKRQKKKKKIVICTGNFSNAIANIHTSKSATYIIASLVNAKSVAEYIARKRMPYVYIVPIGTYYMINYKGKLPVYTEEDLLGSLYILNELRKIKKGIIIEEKEKKALEKFEQLLKNQKKLSQFLQHTLYAETLKGQDKTLGNKKGRIKNINQKDMEFCFKCNKIKLVPKLYKEKNMFVIKKR